MDVKDILEALTESEEKNLPVSETVGKAFTDIVKQWLATDEFLNLGNSQALFLFRAFVKLRKAFSSEPFPSVIAELMKKILLFIAFPDKRKQMTETESLATPTELLSHLASIGQPKKLRTEVQIHELLPGILGVKFPKKPPEQLRKSLRELGFIYDEESQIWLYFAESWHKAGLALLRLGFKLIPREEYETAAKQTQEELKPLREIVENLLYEGGKP